MECVLVAIDGTHKGRRFPVGEDACSIGRDPCNAIQIPEHSASRQHCSIQRQSPEMFLLKDLNSRNGTFRNGMRVTECLLYVGDEIQAGDSRFVFLADEQPAGTDSVQLDDEDPGAETVVTMPIQPDEIVYLKLGQGEADSLKADPLG